MDAFEMVLYVIGGTVLVALALLVLALVVIKLIHTYLKARFSVGVLQAAWGKESAAVQQIKKLEARPSEVVLEEVASAVWDAAYDRNRPEEVRAFASRLVDFIDAKRGR